MSQNVEDEMKNKEWLEHMDLDELIVSVWGDELGCPLTHLEFKSLECMEDCRTCIAEWLEEEY